MRLGVALLAALGMVTHADAERVPGPQPRIVNGVLAGGYPTAGALLRGAGPDTATAWCSGTLIGCSTFLTAGHCVDGRAPSEFQVFLPHAGMFPVVSIALHPSFDFPAADVAVLKLGAAIVGIAPTAIETSAAPPAGTPGVIVGFGRSGDPLNDYGLKRAGNVVTAPCSSIPPPGSDATSVCWNFLDPEGAPGSNSNTCNADSGGPLFVDLGAGLRVAGITSGGSSSSCLATDHSYDASVFTYRSFIQAEGGIDLTNTRCGSGPQVGESGATVLATSGTVDSENPQGTYSFEVPTGTSLLRVAMNAVDDDVSDFDLYVKSGSAPTTRIFDCGRFGPNQFGLCEFPAPAPGPWHVLVNRYTGGGSYQLTITELPATTCASPGSDGNPCDDGNPCTAPDTCQSGVCTGSAVVSGTPCDDGDPCSQPDSCQAGACNGAAPAIGCRVTAPAAALLGLEDRRQTVRDQLAWSWRKGAATSVADLGDPTHTTPYTLCLYDNVAGVAERRLAQAIPPGARWKAYSRGFRYRDPTRSAGGIQSIVLTSGTAGRSSVQVRGRGQALMLPSLPLTKQPNVTIQLLNDTTCWSSTHSTALSNTGARFRAKSD